MYNYIRELHRLFSREPNCAEQKEEIAALRLKVKEHLNDEDKKLMLRIEDTQALMTYETSLESFAAGFRTAYGLACELNADGHYSYEDAETARICSVIKDPKKQ